MSDSSSLTCIWETEHEEALSRWRVAVCLQSEKEARKYAAHDLFRAQRMKQAQLTRELEEDQRLFQLLKRGGIAYTACTLNSTNHLKSPTPGVTLPTYTLAMVPDSDITPTVLEYDPDDPDDDPNIAEPPKLPSFDHHAFREKLEEKEYDFWIPTNRKQTSFTADVKSALPNRRPTKMIEYAQAKRMLRYPGVLTFWNDGSGTDTHGRHIPKALSSAWLPSSVVVDGDTSAHEADIKPFPYLDAMQSAGPNIAC